MMDIRLLAMAAALPTRRLYAGTAADTPPTPPTEAMCNADSVQSLIGQTATGEVGAQLIKGSGATTLRWVPPRTAVTMDFRPDRLTVFFDDALKIERISCRLETVVAIIARRPRSNRSTATVARFGWAAAVNVAGCAPIEPDGTSTPGDAGVQAARCIAIIGEALGSARWQLCRCRAHPHVHH